MTVRRLALLAVTAVAAGLLAVPVAAAPASDAEVVTVSGFMLSRTSSSPQRLTATVTMTAADDRGVVVVFGLAGSGKHRTPVYGGFTAELGLTPAPAVFHDRSAPGCAVGCTSPLPQTDIRTIDTGEPVRAIFYIAARAATVKVNDLAPGWRIQPVTLTMRLVRGERAHSSGGRAARTSVEHFTGATVVAPGAGSTIGVALPCAYGPVRGHGTATLTGAGQRHTLDCQRGPAILGADTAGPATWRLAGDAAGTSPYVYRIVVVDYPKEHRPQAPRSAAIATVDCHAGKPRGTPPSRCETRNPLAD